MVFLDPTGVPMKYDQLRIFKDIVGTARCRIEVDAQGRASNTWRRTNVVIDTANEPTLNDEWRRDISRGTDHVLRETWIAANDPHYELHCVSTRTSRCIVLSCSSRFRVAVPEYPCLLL